MAQGDGQPSPPFEAASERCSDARAFCDTTVFTHGGRSIACGTVWITKESTLEPANTPWKVAGFHVGTTNWSQAVCGHSIDRALARRPCPDQVAHKGELFTIEKDHAKTGHPHSFVRSTQKRMALCNQPEQREAQNVPWFRVHPGSMRHVFSTNAM